MCVSLRARTHTPLTHWDGLFYMATSLHDQVPRYLIKRDSGVAYEGISGQDEFFFS